MLKPQHILNKLNKNYYHVNARETQWKQLMELMNYIYEIVQDVSCNKNEE